MQGYNYRILGIDPGLETTGISILEVNGASYKPVFCSCVITDKKDPLPKRLSKIYSDICVFIKRYNPVCLAIEELFFSANTKTALIVGQARGVALLAGSNSGLEVYEYTPLEIKMAIAGYGRATKKQIRYMLKIILKVGEEYFPGRDDAWDSMAVSVCHANSIKFKEKVKSF
ncbi:MAG: crossover junction endodeoxyribonuclease RuvC [Actinobacteria bacterium]|nr:crossover junction endodeoxyribonuclease RuvC [Actinomycetota bacterium]